MEKPVPKYDLKTVYYNIYGGENGYIFGREKVLEDIYNFIESHIQ